jgi:hypothetical protein
LSPADGAASNANYSPRSRTLVPGL